MRGFVTTRTLAGVCAAAALMLLVVGNASAQGQFHGIAFTKGCTGPTSIGQPLNCAYQILNVVDQGQDTLQVNDLTDVVHAASGDVSSGNILGAVQLVFSGPTVLCIGGSGAGTAASPYIGATQCTLPFGTSITTNPHSFYTVQALDFTLPNHTLTDTATLGWNNTCTAPGVLNCTTAPQQASAGSSSPVAQLPSTTDTAIHNAAHAVVTAVSVGTTVHDFVTVTGVAGAPVPTGNVNIDWFTNGTCTGNPAATSGNLTLDGTGHVDATGFNFMVNTPGAFAFRAHYLGDPANPAYTPSDGPCEPLQVVDANIQITPATATNPVNTNHTLTGHVNVNTGAGFVNAPDGTVITFTKVSGPGTFVGPSSCTTPGAGAPGSGSCTVVITSSTAGTTVVHAATDVTVGGVVLHRETDGTGANSGDAQKIWISPDANIQISPQTATNPVGTNHTLTGHVNVAPDGVTFTNAPAGTTITFAIASGPGSFVGPSSCATVGATGSCTVVITSATAGTTVVNASTTVVVSGVSLTRTTNGSAGNSGPATKVWLDSVVTTRVLDASNTDVTNTTVPSGTVVHDEATVAASSAGGPTPTGTVNFTLFNSNNCTGTVVATDSNKPLSAAGVATSATFTTPNTGGMFSYLAHYNGDASFPAHDAACEPFQVNAVGGAGRVTGGGSIFWTVNGVPNTRITHGEELRCDPNDPRQSLEINWAGGNNFHLDKLINSVVCFDDPTVQPPPPPGTVIDTYAGNTLFNGHTGYHGFGYAVGTGTCNGLPATIYFIFSDAGEPGTGDVAEYHITGGCTLDVGPALIDKGNVQFHKS